MIPKEIKYNLQYDVQGDILRPPQGTTRSIILLR